MRMDRKLCFVLAVLLLINVTANAEEGGSGHYMPGSMASFADGVPAEPCYVVRLNYINYDADTNANLNIPMGGQSALGVDVKSKALGLTLLWAPDWDLGEKWSFAMSTTIPWVTVEVEADLVSTLSGQTVSVGRSDKTDGLGDITLMPLMFNYKVNEDLNINYRIGIYAPTGDYEVGRLANTGKNFWTIEPTVGVIYFGKKNGIEGALFFGVDFNTENEDTNYTSGTQVHLDGTMAQHFPLWGGLAGAGLTGFWYEQITDDSGEGANFGAFKAKAHGIGPVLSYITKVAGYDLSTEIKWLHEFDNEKRPEGDTIFFKALLKF